MTTAGPADVRRLEEAAQGLWRLSQESAPEDFQAGALRVVEGLLRFDACFWGLVSSDSERGLLEPHHVHIDRLSGEALLEYDAIAAIDVVARFVRANPGRTLHFDTRKADPGVPPEVLAFDARHGIEQILCTLVLEPVPRVATVLSLYRSPGSPTFTEEERARVEALVPHLVFAFAACRERALGEPAGADAAESSAVADTKGRLYSSSPALEHLLAREWRGWRGPTLPSPLRSLCLEGGVYEGASIVARVEAPHSSFTRIRVRPSAPAGAPGG
jgi:hypothetical protein